MEILILINEVLMITPSHRVSSTEINMETQLCWPNRYSSNTLVWCLLVYLNPIVLIYYVLLLTNHFKNLCLKQLSFVFAHMSLDKQGRSADLSQAWLFLTRSLHMFEGQLGWHQLDKKSLTNISGNLLSIKMIGWIGSMFLIVLYFSPNLFGLGSSRQK